MYSASAVPTLLAKARGCCRLDSKSLAEPASRKVSSLAGLPWESSPSSTKSRVLVTRTRRYRSQ